MALIDQNSAVLSLDEALIPSETLIDARSETDRLNFLSNFATLINFYDSTNTLHGNWAPFLLKDPVFLLAAISKTNVSRIQAPFLNACSAIQSRYLGAWDNKNKSDVAFCFNQLFDQLTYGFMQLEYWSRYMQVSEEDYDLKQYVLQQINTTFSAYFWAVLSFREYLFLSSAIEGIKRVKYYLFESYNEIAWKQNKGKSPYWEILNISPPDSSHNENTWEDNPLKALKASGNEAKIIEVCFTALSGIGDVVFNFLKTIIHNAPSELEKLKTKRSNYPDTLLLRTFVHLLEVPQKQLNGLTQKHLTFYYNDILKQTKNTASPDLAFICASLAMKTAAFDLRKGTLFNAGTDAQKQPILFASSEDVSLNPATITEAFTLISLPSGNRNSLYLENVKAPNVLKKDEDGKIQGWGTFGSTSPPATTLVETGIAFASPMLLLREGQRTILLTMVFKEGDMSILSSGLFFLSTQTDWLPVKAVVEFPGQKDGLKLSAQLTIALDPTQPPIESFLKNPDGLTASWPMFKILFPGLTDPAQSPVLTNLTIKVTVSNIKGLQLYNDNGDLSIKTPYQLFGPGPVQSSNFIIGSNEIFSKPLIGLYLTLTWDKSLPGNFSDYYQQYNYYLERFPFNVMQAEKAKPPVATPAIIPANPKLAVKSGFSWGSIVKPVKSFFKGIGKVIKFIGTGIWKVIEKSFLFLMTILRTLASVLAKIFQGLVSLVKKLLFIKTSAVPPYLTSPFNNVCFTVDFFLLREDSWHNFNVNKTGDISVSDTNTITTSPYQKDLTYPSNVDTKNLLFSTNGKGCTTDMSFFSYELLQNTVSLTAPVIPFVNPPEADPFIQNGPLAYTAASSSGFMKITLSGPPVGFGSVIYSNVVSWIALQNAMSIAHPLTDGPVIQPPNVPYSPKLVSLTADYMATQFYDLTKETGKDPIQFYLYAPFETNLIYDSTIAPPLNINYLITSICGTEKITEGIPLFPSSNNKGLLFLGLENLVFPNPLNLYFEIATSYVSDAEENNLTYYYLSETGWKNLPVLSDGTNNLSCSGIITVNIPSDISDQNNAMPAGVYWIVLATDKNPGACSQTLFLQTNGVLLQRSGQTFLSATQAPVIASGVIKQPQSPVPQIAQISQPFQSFGGRAAENEIDMNQRISSRIKTKDRVISASDYYTLIRQNHPSVYYSKINYQQATRTTEVFVVKRSGNRKDANAFMPLVSECDVLKIQQFLQERSSMFTSVYVKNFGMQYLEITAKIDLLEGYELDGVSKSGNMALNIFLSPWISSSQLQVVIDQGISEELVTNFIGSFEGVADVKSVSFKSWIIKDGKKLVVELVIPQDGIIKPKDGYLFITSSKHVFVTK